MRQMQCANGIIRKGKSQSQIAFKKVILHFYSLKESSCILDYKDSFKTAATKPSYQMALSDWMMPAHEHPENQRKPTREGTCKRCQPPKRCVHQFVQNHAENVLTGASQNIVNAWRVLQKNIIPDCWGNNILLDVGKVTSRHSTEICRS